jgi:hypothetical protein
MKMFGPILPVQQLHQSKICPLGAYNIRYTHQTKPQVITTCVALKVFTAVAMKNGVF